MNRYKGLDKLFSEFIRKRAIKRVGGCERCKAPKSSWKQLQCSHFHDRRKVSVRFDEDNGTGLCGGCHLYFSANPAEHCAWQLERLGEERLFHLNFRAQTIQKVDINLLMLYYTEKIRHLKDDLL